MARRRCASGEMRATWAEGCVLALENPAAVGETFLLGGGGPLPHR